MRSGGLVCKKVLCPSTGATKICVNEAAEAGKPEEDSSRIIDNCNASGRFFNKMESGKHFIPYISQSIDVKVHMC